MNYTVNLLTNTADCQALINIATTAKRNFDYRKTGLEIQRDAASVNSLGIETELASVNAAINTYQALVDGLPDGPVKDETRNKLTKSQYKKFLLEQPKTNYGGLAVLEKECTHFKFINLRCTDN